MNLTLPSRSQAKDMLARVVTAAHSEIYRRTGGRFTGKAGKTRFLLLTTTGRKSGEPRTTPLNYLPDGDRWILVASWGGDDRDPQWLKNLRANPVATIQVGADTFTVRAEIANAEERARYWPKVVEMYAGYDKYQSKTTRQIPIVILTRSERP